MLLSVVVPCFNSREYLPGLIESLESAGISSDMQVVMVNDGSSDDTAVFLEAISQDKPWVIYANKKNGGAASARNFGAELASGEFLIFLDADDELEKGCLTKVGGFLRLQPGSDFYLGCGSIVTACGGAPHFVSVKLSGKSSGNHVLDYLSGRLSIFQGGYVVRRNFFLDGPFPENFKTQEDIPFFLSSLARGRVCCMSVNMVRYHKYRGSVSKYRGEAILEGFRNIDLLFLPPYVSPTILNLKFVLYRSKARSLLRYVAKIGTVSDIITIMSGYRARVGGRALLDFALQFKALKTFFYVLKRRR